jgi:hypothetical protein
MNNVDKSKSLKVQGSEFLQKHQIFNLLEQFGKVGLTGSYRLDLMNRRDIDLVLVVDELKFEIASKIAESMNGKGFNNFWIFDNANKGHQPDPKHIIVEAIYGHYWDHIPVEDKWAVGISICEEDELGEVIKTTKEVEKALEGKPFLKDTIINLKFALAEKHGEGKIKGREVYEAVLKHEVTTLEEFGRLPRPSGSQ